jgi:hypothetical protein
LASFFEGASRQVPGEMESAVMAKAAVRIDRVLWP